MNNNEEFEKWWRETGIKFITEKTACFGAWQARQHEIDALKHKLAVTDDGFRAAETLLKNLESENAALNAEILQKSLEGWTEIQRLKAELRTLRDGVQTMGDALADGVWAHLISSDDDLNALDAGVSSLVGKLTTLQSVVKRLGGERDAARRPPAPEVEPVAWLNDMGTEQKLSFVPLEGAHEHEALVRATHPANDGLRKAAGEVCEWFEQAKYFSHGGEVIRRFQNLRAELDEGK